MAGKKKNITHNARFNIGRLISIYKRAFDEWAIASLTERGYPLFKISHFAVLMNINENGKTNKEIAAARKDAAELLSQLDAGEIGWGAAFNSMKLRYPSMSNELIDNWLNKTDNY